MKENKLFQKVIGHIIVIGFVIFSTAFSVYFGSPQKVKNEKGIVGKYAEDIESDVLYKVVRVLDGDTLIASVAGHDLTVRLMGMDTPEVVDPRKPVQCFGPEASAKAKELLDKKEIFLEKDPLKKDAYDKYGRVLAYVHFSDGSLYNEYMIEHGFAREYTYNKEKYTYQKEFKADQVEAKKNNVGLWKECGNK